MTLEVEGEGMVIGETRDKDKRQEYADDRELGDCGKVSYAKSIRGKKNTLTYSSGLVILACF